MLPSHCYPPLCWLVVHRHRHPLRILYGDKDDVDIVVDPTPIQVVVAWYYHTISECIPYIEGQKVENEEIAASPCRMNVLWLQWHLCKWPHWKPVETWPHDPRPCGWKAPLHTVFSTLSFVLLALCCSLLYNGVGMVKCVKSRRREKERKKARSRSGIRPFYHLQRGMDGCTITIGQSARKMVSITYSPWNKRQKPFSSATTWCLPFIHTGWTQGHAPCILFAIGDKKTVQSIHVCPTCFQGTHSFHLHCDINDSVDSFRSVDPVGLLPRDIQSLNSYLSFKW